MQKQKVRTSKIEQLNAVARQSGMIMMAMAATLGLVELPEHFKEAAVVGQQAMVIVQNERPGGDGNTQRKEREEAGPHYVSYSAAQRTPGRTGKY